MTELHPPSMPTFIEFYRAINQRDPFPWQSRLANQVSTTEQWPAEVGVPTGLGKTACLDIAVWWLASQAVRVPARRTAPIRIWWVVNRRLLVDSTAEHAERIAAALSDSESAGFVGRDQEIIAAVGHRLRSLAADPRCVPLEVIRLRGGIASRTPTDPSQPAVLLCTLPMYGSRLLFRGYGLSQRMRAVDAAMAGTDSLVLLDEAHLVPHLRTLLPALSECIPDAQSILSEARSKPRMAALTATGDVVDEQRFNLDDEDEAQQIVRQRLDAVKLMELRIETDNSARHLVDATLHVMREASTPAACLVFANTPKTAREAFNRLRKRLAEAEILLLTGLTREREAERIRRRILDPDHGMAATRDIGVGRQRHLIVVATQTLEVGADIDTEYLVTEACGVRALTQRLGRLNRLGRYTHAYAVYVHLPPPKKWRGGRTAGMDVDTWPVYGTEPTSVLNRLEAACGDSKTRTVNLSPRRVAEILGPPGEDPSRAPEIFPGILWEWTKTTNPPDGEAPVEPYFSGVAGAQYSVSLIWRVHVPETGGRLWPRATDREAVDVPIGEVRDILEGDDLRRLASDGITVEAIPAADLRPGDQILLPTDRGLLDEFGWNPSASEPVADVSLVGHGLPLDARAIERLCGVAVSSLIDKALGTTNEEEIDPQEQTKTVEEILSAVRAAATPPGWDQEEWADFTETLSQQVVETRKEVPRLRTKMPDPEMPSDDLDETSLNAAAVDLTLHCQAVASRARDIATKVGLSPDLIDVVGRAGTLHDVGKADRRFQRWLDPDGQQGVLVAKSNTPRHRWEAMRIASGWPRGGRHEDLSARLARAWLEQNPSWSDSMLRDLMLHLVFSHHGKGRPLVPPVADGTPGTVSGLLEGTSVRAPADLGVVDWDQPARFKRLNERFGPWGLALLEAVVIRSDHAVSAGADGILEPPK